MRFVYNKETKLLFSGDVSFRGILLGVLKTRKYLKGRFVIQDFFGQECVYVTPLTNTITDVSRESQDR